MPKLLIEIDVQDTVTQEEVEHHFRYLMSDALAELCARRRHPDAVDEYVEERYAGQSAGFKARKVVSVRARCQVAEALRNGFLSPDRLSVTEEGEGAESGAEAARAPLTDAQWESIYACIKAVNNSGTLSIGDDDGQIRDSIDIALAE